MPAGRKGCHSGCVYGVGFERCDDANNGVYGPKGWLGGGGCGGVIGAATLGH